MIKSYPEILNEFITKIKNDGKAENTVIAYSSWIAEFMQFMKLVKENNNKIKSINESIVKDVDISAIPISIFQDVKINDVEKYKNYLTKKNNDGNSINRKLASIKTFYKFLIQQELTNNNIILNVDRVKQSEKIRKPLTLNETKLLLATIKNSNYRHKERDYFLFLLYLDVGAREFELTNLTLSQIYKNENECSLKLHGKGNKERTVFLSISFPALEEYLIQREKYLKTKNIKSDYLFISQKRNKLSADIVADSLEKYAKDAGLHEEDVSPHCLRHTSATLRYENGADIREIQAFLGHANISTTQRYVAVDNKRQKTIANKMPQLI